MAGQGLRRSLSGSFIIIVITSRTFVFHLVVSNCCSLYAVAIHAGKWTYMFVSVKKKGFISRPLILVMGILANKDVGGFLSSFEGLASGLVAVDIPGHASLAPETLLELAQARGMRGQAADSLTSAVDAAIRMGDAQRKDINDQPPRILICGSLYLAGEVLRLSETD